MAKKKHAGVEKNWEAVTPARLEQIADKLTRVGDELRRYSEKMRKTKIASVRMTTGTCDNGIGMIHRWFHKSLLPKVSGAIAEETGDFMTFYEFDAEE